MKRLTKRKVIAFLARHGIECGHAGPTAPTYTGQVVNLDVMDRGNSFLPRWPRCSAKPPDLAASRILHEVGHTLIVSPARRKMPNYGLGPDNVGGPCKPLARRLDGKAEEAMATALTIALSAVLADTEWALDFLERTGFNADDAGRSMMWTAIVELQRRGLLDGHRPSARAMGRAS